jgi:hypothetical protein
MSATLCAIALLVAHPCDKVEAARICLRALVWAVFARHLRWRGVPYRISGPWDLRSLNYRPY